MKAISVQKVSFSYRETKVLSNIDFTVMPGEFIGIIGPNGGGKTTLFHLLMGFLKPQQGTIEIFNQSPRQARGKIAWVPQNFHYDRHFPISVLEVVLLGRLRNLNFFGKYSKEDQTKAIKSLEKVGMNQFKNAPFAELSGGQAQRVLLARALASNPAMILLDEPTAGVDIHAQTEIYKILSEMRRTITILMVTHDLRAAVDHVEKIFCVQGSLFELSKDEVCKHFALGLYHPPMQLKEIDPV
jgi:zinc transport system ATP-binding protein